MLISFFSNDSLIYKDAVEAVQDEDAVFLSESEHGICSVGHAVCYAVIIQNAKDCALFHLSSSMMLVQNISDIMAKFSAAYPEEKATITLARSTWGYTLQWERDKLHDADVSAEDAEQFFARQDKEYTDAIRAHFKNDLQLVDLSCAHLVIDKTNKLIDFHEYAPDSIEYTENDCDDEEECSSSFSP